MGDWMGYGLAAGYYVAEEYGYGVYYCNISGYAEILFYYLNLLVNIIEEYKYVWFPELEVLDEAAAEEEGAEEEGAEEEGAEEEGAEEEGAEEEGEDGLD